ncbi:MAG: hypothetical protein V3T70_03325 [Phycisphaerae bacterium]
MNVELRLEELLHLAEGFGIEIRRETLEGGGGLCLLRGRRVLFDDVSADAATRYEAAVTALADEADWDDCFVPPLIRDDLDRARSAS